MTNPKLTAKLAQPKLTLFAFHLFSNLAKGDKQLIDNTDHLWKKCVALGKELKTVPNLDSQLAQLSKNTTQDNQQSDYFQLHQFDDGVISFTTTSEPDQLPLTGGIYPLQLHDTYALDFTLLAPSPTLEIEIDQLKNLNFQGCLLPANIQASLGQTLLLFAKPVDISSELPALATDCVNALFPDKESSQIKPYLIGEGTFLGSPIFEFDNTQEDPRLKCHILVWFNTYQKTADIEDSGNYYRPLINLLCCRSKILYANHQAYLCNEKARELYRKLEKKVEGFSDLSLDRKKRLEQLEKWLVKLSKVSLDYSRYLRDMKFHLTTIETNVSNYNYELEQLWKQSLKEIDKLDFLQDFSKHSRQIFQKQIKINRSYLSAGQQLFQQMIETIRGIVEIDAQRQQSEFEKAERESDRSLERTIQILGAGLGAGGIVASAVSGHIDRPLIMPQGNTQIHPAVHSFLWSLGASLLIGAVVGLINGTIPRFLKVRKERSKLPKSEEKRSHTEITHENR